MILPIVEVEYFNSYWMKKIKILQPPTQVFSTFYNPAATIENLGGYGNNCWQGLFPITLANIPNPNAIQTTVLPDSNVVTNFHLEESRIKGGYNNTSVDIGVKP